MMKLVDILARELKAWFDQYDCLSQLRHDGSIINGRGFDGVVLARLEIAEDTHPAGVIVTREQWQTAVDALNAPKSAEWTGEDGSLPPVGMACEFKSVGHHEDPEYQWCIFHGRISDGGYIVEFHHHTSPSMTTCSPFDPALTSFRPIRTAEQIAAEERETKSREMMDIIANERSDAKAAYALYDLGYRKQEQK